MSAGEAPAGVADWLDQLASRQQLTRKSHTVLQSLSANPRLASFGSVREVAEKANVSIGTVTRTAQALGFVGWPALQEELRTLYLASLSASETVHSRNGGQDRPAYASLSRDRDNINSFMGSVDLDQLTRVARAIASSRRTFIVAIGSFNGVGQVLAHNAWLHGYDVRLLAEEAQIVNTVSLAEPEDLVIVISFWRFYESSYQTIQACNANGVPVVLLTETVTRSFEQQCSECIRIPTESIGFSPSLTAAVAVVHAIIAELMAIDPERSTQMIERADREWARFHLVHRF